VVGMIRRQGEDTGKHEVDIVVLVLDNSDGNALEAVQVGNVQQVCGMLDIIKWRMVAALAGAVDKAQLEEAIKQIIIQPGENDGRPNKIDGGGYDGEPEDDGNQSADAGSPPDGDAADKERKDGAPSGESGGPVREEQRGEDNPDPDPAG